MEIGKWLAWSPVVVRLQERCRRAGDCAIELRGQRLRFLDCDGTGLIERLSVGIEGLQIDFVPLGIHRGKHWAVLGDFAVAPPP